MNIGGGEVADQLVRMMLSGTEVTVRLGGSALKNVLALTMALAKSNKVISGKISLGKMLRETRDLRQFPMTPEQYKEFSKLAKKQKILFSAIHVKDGRGKIIDVILPVTELDRANMLFERLSYMAPESTAPQQKERKGQRTRQDEKGKNADLSEPEKSQEESCQEAVPSKKESPLQRASPDISGSSSSPKKAEATTRTTDRPSVEGRLKGFRAQLDQRQKSAPAKEKSKGKSHPKSR